MSATAWSTIAERGSIAGMRVTAWVYRHGGRRVTVVLVALVALYFFLTDRRGRSVSLRYLRRVYGHPGGAEALGRRPTMRDSFRHYLEFGLAGLDRLRFAVGSVDDIGFVVHGEEMFARLVARGEGGVLVGAHFGSFDALRALAARSGVPLTIVMSTRNAARLASVLGRLDSTLVRVFDMDLAGPRAVFALRACIARGEFVAILGDRIGPGAQAHPVRASFLGVDAPFPRGPFVLAAALQCAIILVVGIRRGAYRYEVFAEPLGAPIDTSPGGRQAWIVRTVTEYARCLERHCLYAPYQWFNFFDFWDEDPQSSRVVA